MTADATRIIALLKRALLAPASVTDLAAPDLDLLIRSARRVRLLGRLAAELQSAGVFDTLPPVARDQFHGTLVYAEARARLARWELDRIAWALADAPPSPVVAMKGCAYLLLGLPKAASRIMSDVDLMLPEAEIEAVEKRLNQKGWRTKPLSPYDDHYYRRWTHELPPLAHVERQVEIDLHHNLLPVTARLKPPAEPLLAAAVAVPGSPYRVLDGPDMVLHAMVHLFYSDEMADKLRSCGILWISPTCSGISRLKMPASGNASSTGRACSVSSGRRFTACATPGSCWIVLYQSPYLRPSRPGGRRRRCAA
jgi:hypothetical protein